MFLSLYTYDHKPINFTKGLPPDLSDYQIPKLNAWYCRVDGGYFILHRLLARPLSGWIAQYHGKPASRYIVSAKFPILILYYSIHGNIQATVPGWGNVTSLEEQINFFYFLPPPFEVTFTPNDRYSSLIIQLPEASIYSLVKDYTSLKEWLKKIKTEGIVNEHNIANERFKFFLQDILHPSLKGTFQKKLITASIWELLIEAFRLKFKPNAGYGNATLRDQKQKASSIKEVLLNNIHNQHPPTLNQIVKLTGANKNKIEKLFKEQYGTSIFDFYKTTQMNMIYDLVTKSSMTVNDIAGIFGYNDHSALSYAFKHSFGISPLQLRKQKSIKAIAQRSDKSDKIESK